MDKDAIIQCLVRAYPEYRAEAYHFVFEALDYTLVNRGGARRHVSGPEILEGVRSLALEKFGYLARTVLREWGITSTENFGDIVFHLISVDLLQKTADDRPDDFIGLYDFEVAFDDAFVQTLETIDL